MLQIFTAIRSRRAIYLVITTLVAILITVSGCDQNSGLSDSQPELADPPPAGESSTAMEEPLLLEDEPLLLLGDEPPMSSSDKPAADNSRCFVCHANYLDEQIAVTHARAGIGCAKCHGPSDAHIADESWAFGGNGTAPDIMLPRDRINPSCMACHSRDTIDIAAHEPLFAEEPAGKVCTDCHGDHRLPIRRSTWK